MANWRPQLESIRRIVIVGPGLLGGSVGLGLRRIGHPCHIVGVSRSRQTLDVALQRRCIDEASQDLAASLADAQLVILASPLSAFKPLLEVIGRHDHEGTIVTDVGSTKSSVIASARKALSASQMSRFVGSHPMAGSEQQGPAAATDTLLVGKPCVVTPEPDADPAVVECIEAFWRALGMNVLRMTPAEHDRKSAVISHLPHLASVLLVEVAARLGGMEIASTGFRDTTRLASSNPTIRRDILEHNREAILAAVDAMKGELETVRSRLAANDDAALMELLEHAKRFRDDWTKGRTDAI